MVEDQNKQNHDVQIAIIMTEIGNIKSAITEIKTLLVEQSQRFVTKEEFAPFKWVISITLGIVITGAVGGVLALIWNT